MKETILFSNVIGDITNKNSDCKFNPNLTCILKNLDLNNKNLVFINAPGFENDELYFGKILSCFNKIGINFKNTIEISDMSKVNELENFPKERVYFLMGGNPITQHQLIKGYNLVDELRDYEGVVIGFCAGAINLSKHAIITSDDDFDEALYYDGINRVDITIEPHFTLDDSDFTKNRLKEIHRFCEVLNTEIYAIPDSSAIDVLGDTVGFYGEIYKYF